MDGDHYKVLGLRRDASKEEIKQAFWKLAMQFHPDKHSHSPNSVKDDATRQFKRLSEAYDVLSDDRKRADYNLRSASATHGGYGYYNRGNSYGRYNGASRGGSAGGYRHHNDGNSYGHFSGARRGGSAGGYGASSASDWGAWMNKFKGSLRFPTRHTVVINVAIARNHLKKPWSPLRRPKHREVESCRKPCLHQTDSCCKFLIDHSS
ncbi:chaperone protein dnaJ 72 isoform X2 [Malania oleifera]|uniref:chaperone protein dnaJ 72 isoform X2 n=1 Tax=Malania oleifera TaxID=397392 RepID=UPI0025ADB3CE|nr:chaperone protein dnaJ 72 isoform X2 [Malania oleifera]